MAKKKFEKPGCPNTEDSIPVSSLAVSGTDKGLLCPFSSPYPPAPWRLERIRKRD
jgi:hypothetical protein